MLNLTGFDGSDTWNRELSEIEERYRDMEDYPVETEGRSCPDTE